MFLKNCPYCGNRKCVHMYFKKESPVFKDVQPFTKLYYRISCDEIIYVDEDVLTRNAEKFSKRFEAIKEFVSKNKQNDNAYYYFYYGMNSYAERQYPALAINVRHLLENKGE